MTSTETRPRDIGALSGPLTGIIFLSAIGGAIKLAESRIPRPGADAEAIRKYWGGSAKAARFSATGQLVSVAMLARFTASVAKLAARSPKGAKALRTTAIASGAVSVATLGASAVIHVSLTGSAKDNDELAVKLARRAFALGGPIHGVAFAVLVGVLSLAGLRTRELPKGVAITGFVSSGSGALGPLYFLWEPAGWFIPGGRFPGLIVSGIAGTMLARRKRRRAD
jgi:hypothetical protein